MILFEETKKEPKQVATSFSVDRHRHGEDAYPDFTHLLRCVRLTVVSCAVPMLRQLADRTSSPTSHKLINQSLVTQSYHQFHEHASVTWPELVKFEITMSFVLLYKSFLVRWTVYFFMESIEFLACSVENLCEHACPTLDHRAENSRVYPALYL
jgi:hypothetical protein